MLIRPYQLQELQFAWCNRIYFRTRTHCRRPIHALATLSPDELSAALNPYHIELLEFTSSDIDIRALLSITACEATSTVLSKIKGRNCLASCCQKHAFTVCKNGEMVSLFDLQNKRALLVGIRLNWHADPVLSHPQNNDARNRRG